MKKLTISKEGRIANPVELEELATKAFEKDGAMLAIGPCRARLKSDDIGVRDPRPFGSSIVEVLSDKVKGNYTLEGELGKKVISGDFTSSFNGKRTKISLSVDDGFKDKVDASCSFGSSKSFVNKLSNLVKIPKKKEMKVKRVLERFVEKNVDWEEGTGFCADWCSEAVREDPGEFC